MCSENAELHKVQQLTWVNLQEKDIQFPKLTLTIEPVFIAFSSKHLLGLIYNQIATASTTWFGECQWEEKVKKLKTQVLPEGKASVVNPKPDC